MNGWDPEDEDPHGEAMFTMTELALIWGCVLFTCGLVWFAALIIAGFMS